MLKKSIYWKNWNIKSRWGKKEIEILIKILKFWYKIQMRIKNWDITIKSRWRNEWKWLKTEILLYLATSSITDVCNVILNNRLCNIKITFLQSKIDRNWKRKMLRLDLITLEFGNCILTKIKYTYMYINLVWWNNFEYD